MSKDDNGGFKQIIRNKKAYFTYEIIEKFEAGIELKGTEVKSLREGRVAMGDAFAIVRDSELWLIDLEISAYSHGNINNHEPKRPRRLLMRRSEIKRLYNRVVERGLTMVPLRMYFNPRGWAKVELAIVKGKTIGDKRETIKKREMERDLKRQYGV
ncbi:MAG: SsrA-binding protein SmpB [Planctomycetota bacterium]